MTVLAAGRAAIHRYNIRDTEPPRPWFRTTLPGTRLFVVVNPFLLGQYPIGVGYRFFFFYSFVNHFL